MIEMISSLRFFSEIFKYLRDFTTRIRFFIKFFILRYTYVVLGKRDLHGHWTWTETLAWTQPWTAFQLVLNSHCQIGLIYLKFSLVECELFTKTKQTYRLV